MDVTYALLKKTGTWGIRGPANLQPGNIVGVVKKDGEVKTEIVKDIVYRSTTFCLATIEEKTSGYVGKASGRMGAAKGRKFCTQCGNAFSRDQARMRGGNYNASYCGC